MAGRQSGDQPVGGNPNRGIGTEEANQVVRNNQGGDDLHLAIILSKAQALLHQPVLRDHDLAGGVSVSSTSDSNIVPMSMMTLEKCGNAETKERRTVFLGGPSGGGLICVEVPRTLTSTCHHETSGLDPFICIYTFP